MASPVHGHSTGELADGVDRSRRVIRLRGKTANLEPLRGGGSLCMSLTPLRVEGDPRLCPDNGDLAHHT